MRYIEEFSRLCKGLIWSTRSSHWRRSLKFRKIHGKTRVSECLFQWSCRPQDWNFIKKEALAQVFSCEFWEIYKNTFFTERLWTTVSKVQNNCISLSQLIVIEFLIFATLSNCDYVISLYLVPLALILYLWNIHGLEEKNSLNINKTTVGAMWFFIFS